MSVRSILVVLNIAAVIALAAGAVAIALRAREPRRPQNLEPYLPDEDLEGRRLERVLGWSLVCAAIFAVSLPVYWLREPIRQEQTVDYFDDNAVERGARFYAGPGDETYVSGVSLQCANCHGSTGGGGSAPVTFLDDDDRPFAASWRAPALDTVLLKFSEEEVTRVLNFGRPGTPMAAFGTPGGGPKNDQAIEDIVAFLQSIQISPEAARQRAADELESYRDQPAAIVERARADLAEAEEALADLEAEGADAADVDDAAAVVERAQRTLDWALEWEQRRADVDDGQLLYELQCARCHTPGWSQFDPSASLVASRDAPWPPDIVLGPAGGGGILGFSLRDGATLQRFPDADEHADFIGVGSVPNQPYGIGGIGNGRMPGFAEILTEDQIAAVVAYERGDFDERDPRTATNPSVEE